MRFARSTFGALLVAAVSVVVGVLFVPPPQQALSSLLRQSDQDPFADQVVGIEDAETGVVRHYTLKPGGEPADGGVVYVRADRPTTRPAPPEVFQAIEDARDALRRVELKLRE